MSTFSSIIDRLNDKEKLYQTPFFEFVYDGVSTFEESALDQVKTYEAYLLDIQLQTEKLKEEKDSLNKKALKEVLTQEENARLANIFNVLNRNLSTIKKVQKMVDEINS